MLSRTATHAAYEMGRAEGYKASGYQKWRFVGPSDERARVWHGALLGRVFEYDSEERHGAGSAFRAKLQALSCCIL